MRPVNVTLVAGVAFTAGAVDVGRGVVDLVDGGDSSGIAAGATLVALGAAAILFGVGALRMRRWAWAALMSWAVVGLMDQLLREFFFDHPDHLAMALDAFVVFMLTPIGVQLAFGTRLPFIDRTDREPVGDPAPPAGVESTAADLEILQAFEPVVHYTQGEKFFPMDVEPYVRGSSLWLHLPDGSDQEIVAEGSLTQDGLVERRDAPFGSLFYLRFVSPLGLQESARALAAERRLAKEQGSEFHAGVGRLARGGLLPRLADGAVLALAPAPRDGPQCDCRRRGAEVRGDPRAGRAVRLPGAGRSAGRLDDLPVLVLLRLQPLALRLQRGQRPRVGLGDDLRLPLRGGRPARPRVGRVRVARLPRGRSAPPLGRSRRPRGRGAAPGRVRGRRVACLVLQGRASTRPRCRSRPRRGSRGLSRALGRFWRTTLGQSAETKNPLRIPFIDFARGDGVAVGPGQENDGRRTSSTRRHRGRAATAGSGACSRATRSPARTRRPGRCTSGTARRGRPGSTRSGSPALDRVPPPPRELEALEGERALLQGRQSELERLIPEATSTLQELGVRIRSLRGSPHLAAEAERLEALVAERGGEPDRPAPRALRERGRPRRARPADRPAPARESRTVRGRTSGMPPSPSRSRRCVSTAPPRCGRRSR